MSEKRKVTVNGVEYEVEIKLDDGKWEVSIDGNLYEVEIKIKGRGEASERSEILTEEGDRVQDLFPQRFQEK
ncbi:MAG: hypothetical protein ACPHJ5_02205 [Candidatus Thalassarchaeaceae archaeon]